MLVERHVQGQVTPPDPSTQTGEPLPTFLTCWHQSPKSSSVSQKKPWNETAVSPRLRSAAAGQGLRAGPPPPTPLQGPGQSHRPHFSSPHPSPRAPPVLVTQPSAPGHGGCGPAPGWRVQGLSLTRSAAKDTRAHKLPWSRGAGGQCGGRTTAMDGSSSPMLILLGGCWQWKLSSGMEQLSANSTAGCVVWGSR